MLTNIARAKIDYSKDKNTVDLSSKWSKPQFPIKGSYDIAIVGSGISGAYTLIHYISQLKAKRPNKAIKVVVFDKSSEFWTGIPYGSRSGKQSLIITALKEFLPQLERDRFIAWLEDNYTSVYSSLTQRSGVFNKQWLDSYREAIVNGLWEELFIPRYIFGWYLQDRVEKLLQEAREQNYLQCDLISADVCDIQKLPDTYEIQYSTSADSKSLQAQKVVLAIGSPPNTSFGDRFRATELSLLEDNVCYVGNMYEPSLDSNVERIFNFLKQSESNLPNQILITGSNASALEAIYSLNNVPEAADAIDKFIVVSPSGKFPHRISDCSASTSYVARNLARLIEQQQFTAKQILEAVELDVVAALEQNETIDSTYSAISQKMINALNLLDFEEQKAFVTEYGVKIGKYQRRAGSNYLDVVDKLIFEGRLQMLKGKFTSLKPLSSEGVGFEFTSSYGDRSELFASPIKVVINCAGFSRLTDSSSPLIRSLIERGICTPNDSLSGFKIDENFAASENFYLMGPLVAGNINNKLKVWHAESCSRIYHLSQQLAEVLL